MDVADITDEKFAEALKAALIDAGAAWINDIGDVTDIDAVVDLRKVAQHFRRRVTAEPVVETEAPE